MQESHGQLEMIISPLSFALTFLLSEKVFLFFFHAVEFASTSAHTHIYLHLQRKHTSLVLDTDQDRKPSFILKGSTGNSSLTLMVETTVLIQERKKNTTQLVLQRKQITIN